MEWRRRFVNLGRVCDLGLVAAPVRQTQILCRDLLLDHYESKTTDETRNRDWQTEPSPSAPLTVRIRPASGQHNFGLYGTKNLDLDIDAQRPLLGRISKH